MSLHKELMGDFVRICGMILVASADKHMDEHASTHTSTHPRMHVHTFLLTSFRLVGPRLSSADFLKTPPTPCAQLSHVVQR